MIPTSVLMIIGLLAGFAWSLTEPASYSATTSVVLSPVPMYVIPSATELAPPEVSIDTDAQLLGSPEVRDAIAGALRIDPADVDEHLTVTASANSHVLHVTVTGRSAAAAAEAADAAAHALTEVRRDSLGSLREGQLRQLRLLISNQKRLLTQGDAQGTALTAYDDVSAQILDLTNALRSLEEARVQPAEIVRFAATPQQAIHANTEVYVVSGAMLGLLCGCLLGAVRDHVEGRSQSLSNPRRNPDLFDLSNAATSHKDLHHVI
jgi:hypothetical protein